MTTNTDTHGGGVEAAEVEVEVTDEMIEAGKEAAREWTDRYMDGAEFVNWEGALPDIFKRMSALAASPAAPAAAALPEEMTPAIADALSIMLWTSGALARAYRAVGFDIPCKAEAEQAFVLFRTLRFAIQHGDDWRAAAQGELTKLRASPAPGGSDA